MSPGDGKVGGLRLCGYGYSGGQDGGDEPSSPMRSLAPTKTGDRGGGDHRICEAIGQQSLRWVGQHLRREGHTSELVHGVGKQERSVVDCGCRLDGVTTARTACGQASASARAGQYTEPAVLTGDGGGGEGDGAGG